MCSLMRRCAVELAVYKASPVVNEYFDKWEESAAKNETPPEPRRPFKNLPVKENCAASSRPSSTTSTIAWWIATCPIPIKSCASCCPMR